MLTLAVVATRGGIAKTAAAANLGGLLRDLGHRVLFVDADVHPLFTRCFGASSEALESAASLDINTTNKSAVALRDAATARGPLYRHDPRRAGHVIHQPPRELAPSLEGKNASSHFDFRADTDESGLADGVSTVPSF